jgi:hypothetical protein
VKEEEKEVHRVLVQMREQQHDQRKLELDLVFKEQKLQEKSAFQTALREMEVGLLLHCCHTVVTLLLHWCYAFVTQTFDHTGEGGGGGTAAV